VATGPTTPSGSSWTGTLVAARDLRVLLIAHHANPNLGSEPLIGWRWAQKLDRRLTLTLITHIRNRHAIEAANELEGEVIYIETENLARRLNHINDLLWSPQATLPRTILDALALKEFCRQAKAIATDLVANGQIDVIHRVSPITPRVPSDFGDLGVPFILGPLNGGMSMPPAFVESYEREQLWVLHARGLSRVLDPRFRTFRRASSILVVGEHTRSLLPASERERALRLSENAVDLPLFRPRPERMGEGLRALYVGRLIPYKGVEYLMRALKQVPEQLAVQLDIVGDGPDRARLEALQEALGLRGQVRFHGAVPVEAVPRHMGACDVFCLPSVRESGGATVLEAMAAAKPVIVADHGGPADTVIDEVGFRLPVSSPRALVSAIARALTELAADEPRRLRMAHAARSHVARNYTWDGKADHLVSIYQRTIGEFAAPSEAKTNSSEKLSSNPPQPVLSYA